MRSDESVGSTCHGKAWLTRIRGLPPTWEPSFAASLSQRPCTTRPLAPGSYHKFPGPSLRHTPFSRSPGSCSHTTQRLAMTTRRPRETPPFHVPPTYVRQSEPLPYPATTLVIAQHLFVSHCCRYWAWLIVGTFYDRHDKAIWNSEVFLAMNPEEDSDDESDEESGAESGVYGGSEDETGSEREMETLGSNSDSGGESSLAGHEGRGESVRASGRQAASRGESPASRRAVPRHIPPVTSCPREPAPSGTDSRPASRGLFKGPRLAPIRRFSPAYSSHMHLSSPRSQCSDSGHAEYIPTDTHADPRVDPQTYTPRFQTPQTSRWPRGIYSPPQYWDPARQGPVPGHWNAAFDPSLGWVSYFQPRSDE